MAGKTEHTPISDDELEEVNRLVAAATQGEWRMFYGGEPLLIGSSGELVADMESPRDAEAVTALHNAFVPIIARLEAAERERGELREESAYITQQLEWVSENGGTYQKSALLDFLRRTLHGITHTATLREALAARDAQQRREGAIEAFNEMRLQAEEVGQQSGLAKKMCKIFADECIEQAAKRLREDSK